MGRAWARNAQVNGHVHSSALLLPGVMLNAGSLGRRLAVAPMTEERGACDAVHHSFRERPVLAEPGNGAADALFHPQPGPVPDQLPGC
jgi:hypothetical protein